MTTLNAQPETKTIVLGKFPGAFGQFQAAAWTDLKAAGLSPALAHKIAQDYGADIGNAMLHGDDFGTKISKAKKDGEARINITGKGMTNMTNTMALLRVCQVTSSLVKEKLLKSHKVDVESLSNDIKDYISKCEATIASWKVE